MQKAVQGPCGQRLGGVQEDPPIDVGWSTAVGQPPVENLVDNANDGGDIIVRGAAQQKGWGASKRLRLKTMMGELGCEPQLDMGRVHIDSAVSKSIVAI